MITQKTKHEFIEFLVQNGVLLFGHFTLKSGRESPYFFNAGMLNSGASLMRLGEYYAAALQQSGFVYDMLFGPAYKGIPLVAATAIGLYARYQQDVPYSFNRKEKKNHGDQGSFVGAPLQGKVVMVDDVISAGTTVRETLAMLAPLPVQLNGLVIAFDRQERGQSEHSAVQQVAEEYRIPVYSIATLEDVLAYLRDHQELCRHLPAVEAYYAQYGTIC